MTTATSPRPFSLTTNPNLRLGLLFVAVGGLNALTHQLHPYHQAGVWLALGLALLLTEAAKRCQTATATGLKALGYGLTVLAVVLLCYQVGHGRKARQAGRAASEAPVR